MQLAEVSHMTQSGMPRLFIVPVLGVLVAWAVLSANVRKGFCQPPQPQPAQNVAPVT
jgi:hypothetical protein